jgi:hypothetical protein
MKGFILISSIPSRSQDVQDSHTPGSTKRAHAPNHKYYKDVAKKRQLPCPVGGFLQVSVDDVRLQFGELLEGISLPDVKRQIRCYLSGFCSNRGSSRRKSFPEEVRGSCSAR